MLFLLTLPVRCSFLFSCPLSLDCASFFPRPAAPKLFLSCKLPVLCYFLPVRRARLILLLCLFTPAGYLPTVFLLLRNVRMLITTRAVPFASPASLHTPLLPHASLLLLLVFSCFPFYSLFCLSAACARCTPFSPMFTSNFPHVYNLRLALFLLARCLLMLSHVCFLPSAILLFCLLAIACL